MKKIANIIVTLFYVGHIPKVPGTAASALASVVYFFVASKSALYSLITVSSFALGFWAVHKMQGCMKVHDPKEIVIDEFSAMLLAYIFIPFSLKAMIAGFVIFRILDILKPGPIRKIEKLPGSAGIMLDDVLAALVTNLALRLASPLL